MKKFVIGCLAIALCTFSAIASAETWTGKLFDITPTRPDVTLEYCKSHVPDSYQATPEMVNKEIIANNGIRARDIEYTVKDKGMVYFRSGKAEFSGTDHGKPWKEKVYYYAQMLNKDGPQRGVWYTKDCKGFYSVGP